MGVSDTGLDDRSCYFIDPSEKKDIQRSLITDPFVDLDRRKVVQYSRLQKTDTEDLTAGHGTHVAGTVAGYNQEPLAKDGKYSGVAPDAKIAFLDIATSSGILYIPPVSLTVGEVHFPLEVVFILMERQMSTCTKTWTL